MSLEYGDLKRVIHSEIHIDEYQSKMGRDDNVIVMSMKIKGKAPAWDLVEFIEKGYEWVLDADVSSGEMSDGDWLVFIELPRDEQSIDHIIELLGDVNNLCEFKDSDWRLKYKNKSAMFALDKSAMEAAIPDNEKEYARLYGKKEIDSLKTASGIKVDTKAPKNEYTESLRIAAGIL